MAHAKVPGIYMILNKLNGKVYIGASKDIGKRFSQYRWAVKSDKTYAETSRDIVKAMKKDGIKNFEFTILCAGDNYNDKWSRATAEIEMISLYHADDPDYGYNESSGGEPGPNSARVQQLPERLRRAKQMFLYDTKRNSVVLYLGGAKAIGDEFGYSKDVMSHTVQRGSLFMDRYYIIPAKRESRQELLKKLKAKKIDNMDRPGRSIKLSTKKYEAFRKAVDYVDTVATEMGL